MASKTGPLGIRYSPWSIIFTVVTIAVAYELTAPAAWQLVSALPKGFVIAVLLIGAATILSAFLSDNVSQYKSALKLTSGGLLFSLLSLFAYAVYFYYPSSTTTPFTRMAYSSRQTLRLRSDGSYEDAALNLDNVATLYLSAPFNLQVAGSVQEGSGILRGSHARMTQRQETLGGEWRTLWLVSSLGALAGAEKDPGSLDYAREDTSVHASASTMCSEPSPSLSREVTGEG